MSLGEFAGVERRKFVRVTAEIPLRINFRGRVLTFPGAFSRDVSSGGLGVELDARYADVTADLLTYRGTLEVSVELPDDGAPINATAEVRWVERSQDKEGSVLVGLRFLDLGDAEHQRLTGFVKDLVSRQYREKILGHYEGRLKKS